MIENPIGVNAQRADSTLTRIRFVKPLVGMGTSCSACS
jgi:hypothetical protein